MDIETVVWVVFFFVLAPAVIWLGYKDWQRVRAFMGYIKTIAESLEKISKKDG